MNDKMHLVVAPKKRAKQFGEQLTALVRAERGLDDICYRTIEDRNIGVLEFSDLDPAVHIVVVTSAKSAAKAHAYMSARNVEVTICDLAALS